MKIYKYASIKSAIDILNYDRLLLNNPLSFNDPFDCDIKRDKKDVEKVRHIMVGFTSVTMLIELINNNNIAQAVKNHPAYPMAKMRYYTLANALKNKPYFDGKFEYKILYDLMGLKSDVFKERAELKMKEFEKELTESIEETKQSALATCFSKCNDSLLMWAHYANSHEGVCIEYDRPERVDFIDIKYSKRRPKLKLADLISFITAKNIIDEQCGVQLEQKIVDTTIEPFLVKSSEWKYEQEVRCLITTKSQSPNYIFEDGKHYYRMPKPTKIYVGCRARGRDLTQLTKIAKKKRIKIVFLKQSDDSFSVKEKK